MTRTQIIEQAFPEGLPSLWCPPLTHYTADGAIDRARMAAHLKFLTTWSKGLLVPGTTGDGWELTPEETRELVGIMLDLAEPLKINLLLGTLHPDAAQAQQLIQQNLALLKARAGAEEAGPALRQCRVCGFALCPPRGEQVPQDQMEKALVSVLKMELPIALYQLPQVTQNELSPPLVSRLAGRFQNFIIFKDTSGRDFVPKAALDFGGVVMVRGMEGDYAQWLKTGGGYYDSFLLSTANSFGAQLSRIQELLQAKRPFEAKVLSDRLTRLMEELFAVVKPVAGGNKFTNANKLADHFYALGPKAAAAPPPRLHSGPGLTPLMVQAAGEILSRHHLMPDKGYLE